MSDNQTDPRIEWYPDDIAARHGIARVVGVPQAYTLSFGDGTSVSKDFDDVYAHAYAAPGPYLLTVTLVGQSAPVATLMINVLDATEPNVTIWAPEGTQTIRVSFDDPQMPVVGRYSVYWTPTDREDVLAEPGAYVERVFAPGTYPIRVVDHWSNLSVVEHVTVTAAVDDPDFSVAADPADPLMMTVVLTVDSVASAEPGSTLTVRWGDRQEDTIPAEAGASVSHGYTYPGAYVITAAYSGDDASATARFAFLPFLGL